MKKTKVMPVEMILAERAKIFLHRIITDDLKKKKTAKLSSHWHRWHQLFADTPHLEEHSELWFYYHRITTRWSVYGKHERSTLILGIRSTNNALQPKAVIFG